MRWYWVAALLILVGGGLFGLLLPYLFSMASTEAVWAGICILVIVGIGSAYFATEAFKKHINEEDKCEKD